MSDITNINHKDYGRIKAEVLLLELLENMDKTIDNIDIPAISPEGSFNSTYRQDIISINQEENQYGLKKEIIKTTRPGLYDHLPASFFHRSDTVISQSLKSKAEMLNIIRIRKKEEQVGRKFFRPFDQAFNHYRILIEAEERKALVGFSNNYQCKIFERIWGDYSDEISPYHKKVLFHIAPLAYHVAGDTELTALCLQSILNTPVKINEYYDTTILMCDHDTASINHCHLGLDSVLGSNSDELELTYQIHIGPVANNEVNYFMPKAKGQQLLQVFADFFIPIEVNVKFKIIAETNLIEFSNEGLENSNKLTHKNRLGYTVKI